MGLKKVTPVTIAAVIFAIVCTGGCDKPKLREVEIAGTAMGARFSIIYLSEPEKITPEDVSTYLKGYFRQFQNTTSLYQSDSELIRVNNAVEGKRIRLSNDLGVMIEYGLDLGKKTGGVYNIAAGSIVSLWSDTDLKFARPSAPDSKDISRAIKDSALSGVWLEKTADGYFLTKKSKNVKLDLGSLASGYAVDQIYSYLVENGVKDFIINVGGEIRAKSTSKKWMTGIENPVNPEEVVQRIALKNSAIATSGNYKNRSHIVNPLTGRPVSGNLKSVTVISDSCMEADALATALFAMGDAARNFADQHKLSALFFYSGPNEKVKTVETENFRKFTGQ